MAVSIDWPTKVITVPQSDLTHITGTLYELDTNWLRMQLKALEASEEGITELDTHDHNTQYTVAGVTYARKIEIINGYSIQFTPNSQWSVRLAGSNNNIFDVENGILVQNQVQVIAQNSAGLQVVSVGSGVTEQDKLDIADRVLDEQMSGHSTPGSLGALLSTSDENIEKILQVEKGRWKIDKTTKQLTFYDSDGVTPLFTFDLFNDDGDPDADSVYERVPV